MDFTRAYYVETATILIRTPEEIQNYLAIFEPFSQAVWLLLLVSSLVLIFLITIMTGLEDEQRRREMMHKLAKFLRSNSVGSLASSQVSRGDLDKPSQDGLQQRRFSARLDHRLRGLARASREHEFGDSWLERLYYAVTCVVNILLNRGELCGCFLLSSSAPFVVAKTVSCRRSRGGSRSRTRTSGARAISIGKSFADVPL